MEKKRKRRIWKWFLYTLGTLIVVIIGATWYVNYYIDKSMPQIEGEVVVDGMDQDVKVTRDQEGVPHIEAKTDADLYRAQGYVQAQDRLFQMDLSRRKASGTLSEVVGKSTLKTDKFFRTFSLRNAAENSYDGYSKAAKQVLTWYAEGVNAFIEKAKKEGTLPYEFKLLGYEPEPWTPIDSLTIGKYMAYDLGGHWDMLAFRHWALTNLSPDEVQELMIHYPDNAKSIIEENLEHTVKVSGQFDSSLIPNEFNGSNNWVISGDKTKSGKPLLADDPHLGLSTPSIWYQMHLNSPTQNVSGVIFAGIPGIILGHNEDIAWGVTNVGPDVQDLYIEMPNPDNPTQFKYENKWEQAEVRKEKIKVKGQKPVDYEVIVTRHGPIISNLLYKKEKPTAVFSMQWTALQSTQELQAILNMDKATNWIEFENALKDFKAPAQNFVFASAKDGTIAYKANGLIPIRKRGDGQFPVPGYSADYGWKGYIDFDKLPKVINPDSGYIATANNKVVGSGYPYHITDFWAQPYRYERIVRMLEEKDDFTVGDMEKMQLDTENLYAEEFLPNMIQSVKKQGKLKNVVKLMEAWDYQDSISEGAPLVFHLWMLKIQDQLFKKSMPSDVYAMMPGKYNITDELLRQAYKGKPGEFVDKAGGIDELVTKALQKAVSEIKESFGDDLTKWRWGDYHQVVFKHPLSSVSPILADLLDSEKISVAGSKVTVRAAASDKSGIVNHGASWRFVADLNDLSKAYHIVGPGQSEHMKSKWYHDQVDDWVNGTYHETVINGKITNGYVLILKAK